MTLLQLTYFTALCENLHYTKTAELLHISQPSLSYEIRELERELGAALFIVEKKKVKISEYGIVFLPYAKKILSTLEKGTQAVKTKLSDSEYTVRLGYFHSIGASLVPTIVNDFRTTYPESRIHFVLSEVSAREIPDKVRKGELDLGFSLNTGDFENPVHISRQHLFLYVPAGHRLAERPFVVLSDLEEEPIVMLERGSNLRTLIEQHFSDEDIIPVTAFEVPECNTALQYVALGYGISILPPLPATDPERIRAIPIREYEKNLSREIYLLSGSSFSAKSPVEEVKQFMIEKYSE